MKRERFHERRARRTKVTASGEVLVTGDGSVVINEPIRRSRALLIHSSEAVEVAFRGASHHPPCGPHRPDELWWEAVEVEERRAEELFIKIHWRVSSARTVVWTVFEVD